MQRPLALGAGVDPDVGHTGHEGLGRLACLCAGGGLLQCLAGLGQLGLLAAVGQHAADAKS